MIGQSSSGDN
jgi:sugar lactone lactonase YvrE